MPLKHADMSFPLSLLNILNAIFNPTLWESMATLRHWINLHGLRRSKNLYETLDYQADLALVDPLGKKAVHTKHKTIRYLQNNVVAYTDQAWGDGDLFADYQCSPGIPVDRYREGQGYRVLISLRETKNAGDKEQIHIDRTILNGFTKATESFQCRINYDTRQLTMRVTFPATRLPKRLSLIEQNSGRTQVLGKEHLRDLPDGRQQVVWATDYPRLFEVYTVKWIW